MKEINQINKLLKDAQNLQNKSLETAKEQIARLPKEDQKKYKDLMQKALKGELTVEQLLKEVKNGKDS